MFNFLKKKIKEAVSSLSRKLEEEAKEEEVLHDKGFFEKIKEKVIGAAEDVPEKEPPKDEPAVDRLARKAKVKRKKPKEELDADKIEEIIRDVDIHKPLETETAPEPVPDAPKIEIEAYEHKEAIPPPAAPTVEKEAPSVEREAQKVEAPKIDASKVKLPQAPVTPKFAEEKTGFFGKITQALTTKRINEKQFENLFWELEVALMENNVAVDVIEKIKQDLKTAIVDSPIPRGRVEETITSSLRQSIEELLSVDTIDLVEEAASKKPYVIAFVGVNGSGKTTSIAKVAHLLLKNKKSVVLAAADTFRAAAIDQIQEHATKLGVKLIKHDYGSDPAAVAFDAVKHAEAKDIDVVLIDTAGRLHSNVNLVDEMKKIVRVAKPDLTIFVGESITGNDCVEQAQQFNEAVGIDGIILSKADVDEKGGAAISVSYVTKKPVLYLGMGQEYEDLEPFDAGKILASIGL